MSNLQTTRQANLKEVLKMVLGRERDIVNMLPPDLPFDRFRANITNALTQNAQLLDADVRSIFQACMKAAYDGLRIDGREAAIVTHETTFRRNTQNERKVLLAQYYPMAFGLIQQVLRGGEVISMFADVIREGDEYEVLRGTNAGIYHKPDVEGKGAIIAAYSVATLKSGAKTFEFLTGADLASIKDAAQTDKVWKRWPGEMSKKSAIRRHRKTLPLGDRDIVIRDSEAEDLFPEMNPQHESLPAPAQNQPRPTRQAIADQQGTGQGVDMDLGDDPGEVIDQEDKVEAKKAAPKAKAAKSAPAAQDDVDLPEDEEAWRFWSTSTEDEIAAAPDADTVNAIAKREEGRLKAATKERSDYLRGLISDRLADFATGGEG